MMFSCLFSVVKEEKDENATVRFGFFSFLIQENQNTKLKYKENYNN